jgi:DNA-binding MarR family transcriptional regulator
MKYVFTTSFPYLLNRVGVRMGDLFSRRLIEHRLTLVMYRVLAVLRQEGDQRLSDLNVMVTAELSTLSRLIGTMKRQGLVTRTRVEEDGRSVRISLTARGRALADELMPLAAHFEKVATRTFSAKEVAHLKDVLRQIFENLDELESPK